MGFVVFPAGPADAEALAQVHVTSWREAYADIIAETFLARMSVEAHARRWRWCLTYPRPDDVTLVAAGRDGLVGYASGGLSRAGVAGEAEIATLYVLRAAHGQGAGRQLVKQSARVMAARGATSLMISVLRDNLPARRFYERLGGRAEPPTLEPGPAGLLHEVAYRWPDLGVLIG